MSSQATRLITRYPDNILSNYWRQFALSGGHSPTPTDWTIYTLSSCPYCQKAKDLLAKHNQTFREIPVHNKAETISELAEKTGNYEYFPMIFHHGKFVGGYADIKDSF